LVRRARFCRGSGGAEALKEYAVEILNAGCHLIVLSVGAFAEPRFLEQVRSGGPADRRVYVAPGAICGFDLMGAMRLMGRWKPTSRTSSRRRRCKIRTSRFRRGGDDGFFGRRGRSHRIFPRNVNVAVAAALAGVGIERTRVTVVSKPGALTNTHRIELQGERVRATLEISSLPDPANPKSSTLAAWSVVNLLRSLCEPIVFDQQETPTRLRRRFFF
jgi:aspartate dehydrogenase